LKLPFSDPIFVTRPLIPDIHKVNEKLQEIFTSKWLTNNGTQHCKLEDRLKQYLQVNNLVLFNNGTLALLLGIKALDLKGEVITTPFTFPATLECLDWNGLKPVFCDINQDDYTINTNQIEALITEKTSAILGVHVFGNPCDVNKIQKLADKYNLRVIYDGAHAFGTHLDAQSIGRYGDITMFSFHATKLFHTLEGGAIACESPLLAQKLNVLKNFGLEKPDKVVLSGLNAKMNEIQAAIGLEVLQIVGEERKRRKRIKQIYQENLAGIEGIRILTNLDDEHSSYQYFVIEIEQEQFGRTRDFVHEELKKFNVFSRRYFYPLCSDFPWYAELESARAENLPKANKAVDQALSLPFYGELTQEQVEKICYIIRNMRSH